MVTIEDGTKHLSDIAKLFEEYKDYVHVDMSFQPADETADEIRKRYSGEGGKLYLALVDGKAAGCIAFHPMEGKNACEFKRYFTRPAFRGQHVGTALFKRAMEDACALGYDAIYLDTLARLEACNHIYQQFGFRKIPAYYHNPLPGVLYYRYDLANERFLHGMRSFTRLFARRMGIFRSRALGTDYSLTEARTLQEIGRAPGKWVANQLAQYLSMDRSYMTRTLNALEKRGIVRREAATDDARKKLLYLTPAGAKDAKDIERRSDEQMEAQFGGLSAEQKRELLQAANVMKMYWDA